MSDSATLWTAVRQASLSFIISWSLLKLMSIKSVTPSNHLILCQPLLLLPSIYLSIRVFSNESTLRIGWPQYWGFSFSISPSNSGLISFLTDWFDLLAVGFDLFAVGCHHLLPSIRDYWKNHSFVQNLVSKHTHTHTHTHTYENTWGFSDGSDSKESASVWFDPWVGKIAWRREWLPTPVFLPGESHEQKSPVGYSPWGRKKSDKA